MKLLLTYFITAVLIITVNYSRAQYTMQQGKISGVIADSTSKKPVEFATIYLKTNKDSLLKTGLSGADGKFRFDNLKPGKYKLTITFTGYSVADTAIDLTKEQTSNTGVIYLAKRANDLKEVTITANRPIVQAKADRIIYDMQADPDSKSSSVLDMIHKIPYLSLDANNTVLMKGNTSYKVLINGKPSGMLTNNLTDILRSMPASTVVRIEVITIPPSKYDAEGMAGVINIITTKKINNGYKGTVNINNSLPAGGPGIGASFTAQQGKFGINAYGGASIYNSPQTKSTTERVTTDTDATDLKQSGLSKSNSKNVYFGTELSYEIDSLNLLSGNFNISGYRNTGSGSQTSTLDSAARLVQGYDLATDSRSNGGGVDASINYQLGFKSDKNKLLTFSYQYSAYGSNATDDIAVSDPVNYTTPDYTQYNNQDSKENTFQVDYTQPLKKVNMEAGVKAILRDSKSNFEYRSLDSATDQFIVDPTMGNMFNYTQDVFGVYNSYQFSLKKWSFNGGLRAEETYVDADFMSSGSNSVQNYFNVVPSISVNKSIDNSSSFNFGFTQRIRRPSIYRLNPYVDRSDPDFVSSGNPNLRPVIMNMVQAGYNYNGKKISVFISSDYMFFNNLDLPVTSFNPATGVTTMTYENTGKGGGVEMNFNLNYSPAKLYNLSINAYALDLFVNGTGDASADKVYTLLGNVSVSNAFRFDKGWSFSVDGSFYSKTPYSLQGVYSAFATTSLSVNKELVKNKLFLSAKVNNPFTKFQYRTIVTDGPGFMQYGDNQSYFRSVNFSITYNFGGLNSDIKKSRKGIRNDDVSSGKGGL
jgi:ferric enterobactin receptor